MANAKMILLFFASIYITLSIGCKDPVVTSVIESPPAVEEPVPRELTPEETFSKLKLIFPNPILDENFQTLHALTSTDTYLDFLSQAYPTETPFQTLDSFLETRDPDPQRYLPFLEDFIEKPNEADIIILDQITQGYRNANVLQHQLVHIGNFNEMPHVAEKKIAVIENKEIQEWIELQFRNRDRELMAFFANLEEFVIETEKEDALRIRSLFDEYGEDAGMIWLAVLEPALTGHILNDFSDPGTVVFLKWVSGDFFPDAPLNIEEKLNNLFQ